MYNTDINVTTSYMNNSMDYVKRFLAEYWQTKIRYDKLHGMLVKYDAGKLDFTPTCPIDILRKQASVMGQYLYQLEVRAVIEEIDLVDGLLDMKSDYDRKIESDDGRMKMCGLCGEQTMEDIMEDMKAKTHG